MTPTHDYGRNDTQEGYGRENEGLRYLFVIEGLSLSEYVRLMRRSRGVSTIHLRSRDTESNRLVRFGRGTVSTVIGSE